MVYCIMWGGYDKMNKIPGYLVNNMFFSKFACQSIVKIFYIHILVYKPTLTVVICLLPE